MLYSRAARPFLGWSHLFSFNHPDGMCPACKGLGKRIAVDVDKLVDRTKTIREGAIRHPDYDIGKWYYRQILWSGVLPADKPLSEFSDSEMDRLLWADKLAISYDDHGKTYQRTFDGVARKLEQLHVDKDEDQISGVRRAAYKRLFHATACRECTGDRLNKASLSVQLAGGYRIGDLINLELTDLDEVLAAVADRPEYDQIRPAVETLVSKMRSSLRHLIDIGWVYLSLNRGVNTLSGGESQRVKMARQLDCDLIDFIYILDEPSVGLHARDIDQLIGMLCSLRDAGNSVLVVEHDTSIIRAADWIVDIGPEGGEGGGQVLYCGPPDGLVTSDSPTGRALASGPIRPRRRRRSWSETFTIADATRNNLRNVSVEIPKGVLTCVTGVAGRERAASSPSSSTTSGTAASGSSSSTRNPWDAVRAPTPPPTSGSSMPSAKPSLMPTGSARPCSASTPRAPAPNAEAKAMSRWNSPSSTMSGSSAPCAGGAATAVRSSNTATTT